MTIGAKAPLAFEEQGSICPRLEPYKTYKRVLSEHFVLESPPQPSLLPPPHDHQLSIFLPSGLCRDSLLHTGPG